MKFAIFFVPRRSTVCEKILEDAGVKVPMGDIKLDLIPFDNHLLSLELDASFRELYLERDTTSLCAGPSAAA